MSDAESLAARVRGEAALDGFARGEGDRVDDDVELPPFALEQVESGVDLLVDGDVQRHRQFRAEGLGERLDALLHLVVGVGEGELGAFAMHGLGDAPGDRTICRHAHDEGALAGKKSH